MAILVSPPKSSTDTATPPPVTTTAAPVVEKTTTSTSPTATTTTVRQQSKKDGLATLPKSSTSSQSKGTAPPRATRSTSDSSQQRQERTKEVARPTQSQPGTQKKVSRRSSKPIINWFQRKLASTGRARRASEGHNARPPIPPFVQPGAEVTKRERANTTERPKSTPGTITTLNDDIPPVPPLVLVHSNTRRRISAHESVRTDQSGLRTRTSASDSSSNSDSEDDRESLPRSSLAPESMWSPSVAFDLGDREADEDASVRPLPPSGPPSPSPSHSSSSYLSHPYTFRSMAASTKPTTVLSIDLGNPAMAHIAEPPLTPLSQTARFPHHVRQSSLGASSITFALPQAQQPSPAALAALVGGAAVDANGAIVSAIQAPLHTTHHPRYNPRPSSVPPDDASVLTLASSAFGVPGARIGANALSWAAGGTSALELGADSVSQFDGPGALPDGASAFDDVEGEREANASMRALRSRRSWESEASRWSARIGGGTSLGPGTPIGERSIWAGTSYKTGGYPGYVDDREEGSNSGRESSVPRAARDSPVPIITTNQLLVTPSVSDGTSPASAVTATVVAASATTPVAPTIPLVNFDSETSSTSENTSSPENGEATPPAGETLSIPQRKDYFPSMERGVSFASTRSDGQTDIFVSAPSTPLVSV